MKGPLLLSIAFALAVPLAAVWAAAPAAVQVQVVDERGLPVRDAVVELCLLYTSDAADERSSVDLGGRRIINNKNTSRISPTTGHS